MSYIRNTLLPDEKLIFKTGPHVIVFFPCFIWLAIFIGMFLFLPKYVAFSFAPLALAVFYFLSSYVTYISSEYGITDKRILMKTGLIRRTSLEIFFHKIESINVTQTIPGRILDYGSVIICGTGSSKDPFVYIPDPLGFRRRVQEQMEKMLQKNREHINTND